MKRGRQILVLGLIILIAALLLTISPLKQGYYFFESEGVNETKKTDIRTESKETSSEGLDGKSVLIRGDNENGYAYVERENNRMLTSEANLTTISSGTAIVDSLLTKSDYLREEGYNRSSLPLVVFLECAQVEESSNRIAPFSSKESTSTFSNSKDTFQSNTDVTVKEEIPTFCSVSVNASIERVSEVASVDSVDAVYLDRKYYLNLNRSVPAIDADKSWNMSSPNNNSINGSGVTVAILDTGIDINHPDFQEKNVVREQFAYSGSENDSNGHGTHCSGIAAGTGNASNGTYTGVAPGANLMVAQVLEPDGRGYLSNIMQGLGWALDPNYDTDYSDHADVVSLSFGVPINGVGSDPLSQMVDLLVDKGVVVSTAAGNAGRNGYFTTGIPAVSHRSITVGAYNEDKNSTASFSSKGPTRDGRTKPEVIAPGVDICAANATTEADTHIRGGYCGGSQYYFSLDGTSMAAPHVAGASALILQAHPDWTPSMVKSSLVITSKDLGEQAYTQGAGLIDVDDAIETQIITDPPIIDFNVVSNETKVTRNISITNIESKNVSLNLSLGDITNQNRTYPDSLESNVSVLNLTSGESKSVRVTLFPNETMKGPCTSFLNIESDNQTYNVPISFSRYSKIIVGSKHGNKLLRPLQIFLYNRTNYSDYEVVVNDPTFGTEFGNNYTFVLKEGKYKLVFMGDSFMGPYNASRRMFEEYDMYKDYNYILGENVNVTFGDKKMKVYDLENQPVIEYPDEGFNGKNIGLEKRKAILQCTLGGQIHNFYYFLIHPPYESPGKFYLSNNMCKDQKLYFHFYGSPGKQRIDVLTDEYYFGGWKINESIEGSKELGFGNYSTANFNHGVPGTLNYSSQYYDSSHIGSFNFWSFPSVPFVLSYRRKVPASLERTIYYLGDAGKNEIYSLYNYLSYRNEKTIPQLIEMTNDSREMNFTVGKNPYQIFSFNNYFSNGKLHIDAVGKIVKSSNNTFLKSYGFNEPKFTIYKNGVKLDGFKGKSYWNSFEYSTTNWSKSDTFSAKANVPLKYPVPQRIFVNFDIGLNNSEINPPKLLTWSYDPFFGENESTNFTFTLSDSSGIADVSLLYKPENEIWRVVNLSINLSTNLKTYKGVIPKISKSEFDLKVSATDELGNNISYEIVDAGIPEIQTSLSLSSSETLLPGQELTFNGNLNVNDSDAYGFFLHYRAGNFSSDSFFTSFNSDNRFRESVRVPIDFDKEKFNLSLKFEGAGAYTPSQISKVVNVTIPFYSNQTKRNYSAYEGENLRLKFSTKNGLEFSDKYSIHYNTTLQSSGISYEEFNLSSNETKEIEINLDLTGESPGSHYFNLTIVSNETNYTRDLSYLIEVMQREIEKEGSGGGGGGGLSPTNTISPNPSVRQVWASLDEGEVGEMIINNSNISVKNLDLKVNVDVNNPSLEVESYGKDVPENIEEVPNKAYEYLDISYSKSDETVNSVTVTFTIDSDWLDENNIDLSKVRLYHYKDGEWVSVETKLLNEGAQGYEFEAETDSFSFFAVSGESVTEVTEEEAVTEETTEETTTQEVTEENVTTEQEVTEEGAGKAAEEPKKEPEGVNKAAIVTIVALVAVAIVLIYYISLKSKE